MSHQGDAGPTGSWWMSRWIVSVASLAALAVVALTGTAVLTSRSSNSRPADAAWHTGQPSTSSSLAPAASTAPTEASTTPSSTATPSAATAGSGQQPGSAAKPVITAFSATANGLIVTVSFTFRAQADRGPFTCSVRRSGGGGTDEFACNIGQVSRTYDFDFCCGSEIYVIATDRYGVRSDQWDGWVDFPRPPLPTYSNLEAWHDGESVFVQFYVTSAPGDDPKCDISISEFTRTPEPGVQYREYDQPCEGTYAVAFRGPPGSYSVTIIVSSDAHFNPPPPDPAQIIRAE